MSGAIGLVVLSIAVSAAPVAASTPVCAVPANGASLESYADAIMRVVAALEARATTSSAVLSCAARLVAAADLAAWPPGATNRRPTSVRPGLASWPHPQVLRRYAAEILWRAADLEVGLAAETLGQRAATLLLEVATRDGLARPERADAAFDAATVFSRAPRRPGRGGTPLIQTVDRLQLAALDAFLSVAKPADPRRARIVYLRGQWHYTFDKLGEAKKAFAEIVTLHSGSEFAPYSAALLLDVLILERDTVALRSWVARILATPALVSDAELAERLHELDSQLRRKRAESLENSGDYSQCARAYLEIANRHPAARWMDEVLYNAGVCAELAGEIGLAIRALERLRQVTPKSRLAARALIRVGGLYGSIVEFDRAATAFEEYAARYAGEKDAVTVLSNAIRYRRALGQDDKVIRDTEQFVKLYGRKLAREAAAAALALTDEHERRGADRAIGHLEQYLRSHGSRGGRWRLLVANARAGALSWKASCRGTVGGLCTRSRDARRAKKAIAHLRAAEAMPRLLASDLSPAEMTVAEHWLGVARLTLADAELERRLSPATRSELVSVYLTLARELAAPESVIALVRVAQIEQRVGTGARARAACVRALRSARSRSRFPDEAVICDHMLERAAPQLVRPREAHGRVQSVAPIIDLAPMLLR